MTLAELVEQFMVVRATAGLVLDETETLECAVRATRMFAAYGDIASLSGSDQLPGAAGGWGQQAPWPDPEPAIADPLPVKDLCLIDADVELTVGEWAIISPLFSLYVEKENAIRLEASRGMGTDPYGRSVAEVAGDIERQENEVIPAKAFRAALITV